MKSKIGIVLFALLFAVGFGAGGVMGFSSLAGQLHGWWQARSWQAVPATVIDAALQESHGDSTTYQATAQYRFVFDGRSYDGTRVGFGHGFDNVGSWQQDHYVSLAAAKREGRSVQVWVDPQKPERSVIDRNLRWSMIAFTLPFAILFPLVSIGALWVIVHVLRTPAQELSAPPKLERNARQIRSDARASARTLWGFAIFWGMIAFPIAFVVVPEQFGRSWVWLLVMLFPLIGAALIWAAATRTIRFMRNGEVTIALSPVEPRLGESMTVQASFAQMPPAGEYAVSLLCEEVDTRGDDTRHTTAWRQERVMQVNGMHAITSFLPPAHLSPSQPHTAVYHRWRVLLSFPGAKDERGFDVVIGPADPSAIAQAADEHTDTDNGDVSAQPVPQSTATIVDEFSRLRINYPANARGSAIAALLGALAFGGGGAFLLFGASGAVATLMGLLFAAIAIALLGACVYALTHRRLVEVSHGRLRVEDHWLLRSSQQECAVTEVRTLISSIHGTTTIGNKRYDHHQIKALLQDEREMVLASDLRDAGVALTISKVLQRHLGVPRSVETTAMRTSTMRAKFASLSPAKQAQALRMRGRAMTGIKVLGALLMLAWVWDFFNEPAATTDAAHTTDMDVEAPRERAP